MIEAESGIVPTLLLDDPEAELDSERLTLFIAEVERLRCQVIFTALHQAELFGAPDRLFHVEQGRVQPVV
jgi:recombinational DNA repair ATPase RecF